jgi:transposase
LAIYLVVESTDGLERRVVDALQAAKIPMAIANPRKAKGFATDLGKAKNAGSSTVTNYLWRQTDRG